MSTLTSLGWPSLLAALGARTRTPMGLRAATALRLCSTPAEVRAGYALVTEIQSLEDHNDHVPIGDVPDIVAAIDEAGRGMTLPRDDLRRVGWGLAALRDLRLWADRRAAVAPALARLVAPIVVDAALVETLRASFDAVGDLSAEHYPQLGVLRMRIQNLTARIRSTLDELLRDESVIERLQDRYVTERNGRYVLPVKAGSRRGFGISHGTSQSGETVFVEPTVVVEIHNDLREAEAALEREEHQILTALSRQVGAHARVLGEGLEAATEVDLWCARQRLGSDLKGMVPDVGNGGVLIAHHARHPLLALSGSVIPNDLALTAKSPALVLTGPNAGGKTVALKTLGLFALMARACIPVPSREPSRVDVFDPVIAEIGDQQSVEEGLSTFSAHLLALKRALDAVGPKAMVLIDEIAVGTDPAQGAALARAVVEALLDGGARVAVTTHYPELKAVTDPRFAVAAAQFEEGRPTFRLVSGAPGASLPLAVARRLGMPEFVLIRANEVLDSSSRELAGRLEKLDEEARALRLEREAWERRTAESAEVTRVLAERERRLKERADHEVAEATAHFKTKLKQQEEEVRRLVAALQADPSLKRANEVLAQVRQIGSTETTPDAPPPPAPALAIGARVRLRGLGTVGTVRTVNGTRVELDMGALRTWVEAANVELVSNRAVRHDDRRSRARDREEAPAADRYDGAMVRVDANTCDLRGLRLDEAMTTVELFLNDQSRAGFRVCFVLHGHGTGAIKQALRAWLPTAALARRWRPADGTEGGDAFTVVELK